MVWLSKTSLRKQHFVLCVLVKVRSCHLCCSVAQCVARGYSVCARQVAFRGYVSRVLQSVDECCRVLQGAYAPWHRHVLRREDWLASVVLTSWSETCCVVQRHWVCQTTCEYQSWHTYTYISLSLFIFIYINMCTHIAFMHIYTYGYVKRPLNTNHDICTWISLSLSLS